MIFFTTFEQPLNAYEKIADPFCLVPDCLHPTELWAL